MRIIIIEAGQDRRTLRPLAEYHGGPIAQALSHSALGDLIVVSNRHLRVEGRTFVIRGKGDVTLEIAVNKIY